MTKIAILAVALTATICLCVPVSAETLFENWSAETATVRIDADGKQGWIHAAPEKGRKKGRFLGMFGCKLSDLSKVKLGFNEGRLVVDTTDCDLTQPKSFIRVCFAMPVADIPNGPKIDFVVEMKAPPGARWEMGHNGRFTDEAAPVNNLHQKKMHHYWNVRPMMSEDAAARPYVYSRTVPVGLKSLHFDVRLETSGVFEFGRISWEVAKASEQKVDPRKNLLVNGGAERGWYGTAMANTITFSESGKYLGQDGHWFTTSAEPAIDMEERHSGRASFRFHVDHDRESIPAWGPYNMEFNQIPVIDGKPLVFTCWAKADRNGRRLNMRLNTGNGGVGAYCMSLKLTTEWKRYKLLVKSVGQKQNGSYGDLQASFGLVTPRLDIVSPGTFWIDDCGVFQAEDGDYELEPICVSGAINKKSTIYYAGERISASIKIQQGLGRDGARPSLSSCRVSSKALDFKGAVVAETPERGVALKDGGAELSEELKLPVHFRGPVQWLFTVKGRADDGSGEVRQDAGFNLGVIDVRKPLLKRMGYNLPSSFNVPRMIELMKDFRIGSARIWDSKARDGSKMEAMSRLHEAGVDILYCFSNAGVLPYNLRYLVVKDPTEWQNHISDVVTNMQGKICAYEILNEPNARSGMGRNPDPAKYDLLTPETDVWCIKTAAEAIRRHDSKSLIVGPTTCHTDLGWTLDVLARGAAAHLDVISEHPYCAMPEVPDYRKQVETLVREGTRIKGRHMPSWATERGKTTPSNPEHGCIYPRDAQGAALIVRTMIVGFAGGSERYFDFQLGTHNSMISYINIHNGNPDNDYMARPSCLPYAQRALMDLIEDAPCVKELDVGVSSRAYVFDRGDRRVVAMWKFMGEPRKVKLPAPALVHGFMGTPETTDEIALDVFPQYLVTKLPVDKIEGLFASLDFGAAEKSAAEERREQLKVPYFENEVDWSKAAVVAGRKADAGARAGRRTAAQYEPKPGDALEVRLAWNRTGLMMRAVVEKDGFHPDGDVMNMWKGDGLQIAFDTTKNAQKAGVGYEDDDFEYDLAMFKGRPTVYRRKASLAYHDSLHKPLGVVEDVALEVKNEGRKTIYTIRFAPQAVSPFRLNAGESMRFAVLANLNDGKTRYGALETAPGIFVRDKWPYGFQELVLIGQQ